MLRTKRGTRIVVRISETLRWQLEAAADEGGRPLADFVRDLLVNFAVQRIERAQQAGA